MRTYTASSSLFYRYGFNGKENDNEVKGEGNQQDYGNRIYDPRVERFLSVDPITNSYPELTPYQFASGNPIMNIDIDGLEGMAGNMASPGKWHIPGDANDDGHLTKQELKQGGTIMTGTALLPVEVFVTKGWITRTLFASQIAGAFEHNRATTPEGRIAQDMRSRSALADALISWGAGKILGVSFETGMSALKGVAKSRFNFAKDFYESAGYNDIKALSHTKGVDLTNKVFETTLKKGTELEQWTFLDKNGKPILGDYYTLPGANPNKLGISLNDPMLGNRVKTTVILNEDTKFLQSTASDIENWNKPGEILKGGETQFFQTNVKVEVKK
ncbi:RHS repeat domain-containing protein [Parafilimonas terrae]|uniref:RHS repeat-associated core domain-containing protein n=1 Tax=Parafilimonas terrae TaxID=1465490 RepID=A0A1I5T9M0_9BACT|nr:RHS repeat-associated core domain-containing protein [Parafilimonas terrae]SFP79739.1 RHS repeat-associated core domain-containing protein [Parafilimonas terrae]